MKANSKMMVAKAFLGLVLAGVTGQIFAAADVRPISLKFEDVAATGGEFPHDAYQRVFLKFKNVGNQAVGRIADEVCPIMEDDLFCTYDVLNLIKGIEVIKMEFAITDKEYGAGETFTWELGLPLHTLTHCQATPVQLDRSRTMGQGGSSYVYVNDTASLTAINMRSRLRCFGPLN